MATTTPRPQADTATRILDVAERLVQTRGFNGFSYADIAAELNLTKAGLHYHFAGKAELGEALIDRYAERFGAALENADAQLPDARSKLDAYVDLYTGVLRQERMCLCGMLAAEYHTLPSAMRDAVAHFFDDNEAWLTRLLAQGRTDGALTFDGSPEDTARMIVSALEGAMLIARARNDIERFQTTATGLLAALHD
jgi:TetR/AcrR family transcriptional regulator, transcriptional repressor for nem operon